MSDEHEIVKVHTCGLCDAMCSKSMVSEHDCLQGYNQLWINPQTLFFYPLLDDNIHIIVRDNESEDGLEKRIPFRKLLNEASTRKYFSNHQNNVSNKVMILDDRSDSREHLKRKLSDDESNANKKINRWRQDPRQFTYEDEEAIIQAVREREPLWNNKLTLQERSTRVRLRLWQEISDLLEGKVSAEGIKAKFKNLWDSYRRIIQAEIQTGGGSNKKENKRKWHHYDSMDFLRESVKEVSTNVRKSMDSQLDDTSCEMANSQNILTGIKSRQSVDRISKNFNVKRKLDKTRSNIRNSSSDEEQVIVPDLQKQVGLRNQRRLLADPLSTANSTALERIADAFCLSQMKEPSLPPIHQRDEIDSILFVIGCRVRKLSRKKAMTFLNKCFMDSYALEIEAEEVERSQ